MNNVAAAAYGQTDVSERAYKVIREFIYAEAGIDLGPTKQMLVSARLTKRLRHHKLESFDAYANYLVSRNPGDAERQMAIDLLTTNETYFFREPEHLEILEREVLVNHPKDRRFRLWSAASSSGEEAYSIAMILDDYFGDWMNWEILGSDISSRIIRKARKGLYQCHRIDAIPKRYLKKYCMKGKGEFDGFLLVDKNLRSKTHFSELNLIRPLPNLGYFDVIFLRNVLIYFDNQTKEKIIRSLASVLRLGGILFIGHSESLKGMDLPLKLVGPTTYQKI